MAEPKRFDINKIENFLKNSADKAQTLSYWNAAIEHGKTVKEIDENLTSNVDDKQIADLLLRRTDSMNRRDRLVKAVENAIKVKYQPQIPEIFSTVNKEMQSRLAELQQQSSSVGRVQMLMSALQDENQILNYLDLDEKKRAIDRLMDSNKKLREDSIANGKIVDEEDYAAACQELLQKRSDIKTKIEDLLKTGEGGAILRSLEDAEQRLADVRASVAADKSSRNGTSPQKEPEQDERALEMLKATTKFDGERYEVGLLWKNAKPHLPNNYSSAVSQLKSLERRLEKDENLKQRYKETIDVDVQKGFVRILDEEELENTKTDLQWYVPHLPVLNPNKPDKVRRVCNAASKFGGVSLNDNLMAGPDLLQSLIGIIFRFREKEIALTADVEAMFLQVKVPPTDCRVLRFLWRENHTDPISVYEYGRHIFGAKSSPTCVNYALQQVGRDSRDDNGMVAKLINRNFYMDDFVKSVASREEAVEAYKCLRKSLADRGFQLTKWICNSEKVMEEIPSEDRSDALSKTFEAEPLAPSILGLQWNVESDSLEICRGTGKEVPVKITQRIVLSHVSSVFDPLGLFSPFTVRMRLLLKGIWKKHGQSWDEQVSPEDEIAFKDWASELSHMNEMAIKRKYLSKNAEVVDLHIFADASL